MIKPETIESLERYRDQRIPTGGFLHAVLTNDLLHAVMYADDENRKALAEIVVWCYNRLPSASWQSPEAVKEWLTGE